MRMNLSISGHHVSVTAPLREYVTIKLERIRRHFDQVIDVHAVLSVDKLIQKVEIGIHVSGKDVFAHAQSSDLYAAIDLVIDKLDRQIMRHKGRVQGFEHVALKHQTEDLPETELQ
jgi:putative sigma-54 modulation protein